MLRIDVYSSLDSESKFSAYNSIKDIFFLSSSIKSFTDEIKKEAFFKRWCGDYLDYYPEQFYLLYSDQKLMGYLSGCENSIQSLQILNVPGHETFSDLFSDFPAHLHINFHPDSRGKGFGSLLVKHYLDDLLKNSIYGVHLVTSEDAPNVSFYGRLGFKCTLKRTFKGSELFFMGKHLSESGN